VSLAEDLCGKKNSIYIPTLSLSILIRCMLVPEGASKWFLALEPRRVIQMWSVRVPLEVLLPLPDK